VDRIDIRDNCYYDYDYYCDDDCMNKLDGNLLDEKVLVDNQIDDMDLVDILLDCILVVENNPNFPDKQRMSIQMGLGFDCSVIQVSAPLQCGYPSQLFYFVPSLYCFQRNSDFLD